MTPEPRSMPGGQVAVARTPVLKPIADCRIRRMTHPLHTLPLPQPLLSTQNFEADTCLTVSQNRCARVPRNLKALAAMRLSHVLRQFTHVRHIGRTLKGTTTTDALASCAHLLSLCGFSSRAESEKQYLQKPHPESFQRHMSSNQKQESDFRRGDGLVDWQWRCICG